jgi:hypothetical protein
VTYQSLNPATGKLLMAIPDLTNAVLESTLTAARACYRTWRLTSYAERAGILMTRHPRTSSSSRIGLPWFVTRTSCSQCGRRMSRCSTR